MSATLSKQDLLSVNERLSQLTAAKCKIDGSKEIKEFSDQLDAELVKNPEFNKLDFLRTKYNTLIAEHKKLERESKNLRKEKERSNIVAQQKSKLESLCRELQKENRLVKSQLKTIVDQEALKRDNLTKSFDIGINEIRVKIDTDHAEKVIKLKENDQIQESLKKFQVQVDLQEKHVQALKETSVVEKQLFEARLEQASAIAAQDRNQILSLVQQLEDQQMIDSQLKKTVELQSQKFEQIQSTLTASNELFEKFKSEIDKKNSIIKKHDKEIGVFQKKFDVLNKNILQMVEEKTKIQALFVAEKKAREKLEGLCRALQARTKE